MHRKTILLSILAILLFIPKFQNDLINLILLLLFIPKFQNDLINLILLFHVDYKSEKHVLQTKKNDQNIALKQNFAK